MRKGEGSLVSSRGSPISSQASRRAIWSVGVKGDGLVVGELGWRVVGRVGWLRGCGTYTATRRASRPSRLEKLRGLL